MEKKLLFSFFLALFIMIGIYYYSQNKSVNQVSGSQIITSISAQEFKKRIDSSSDQDVVLDLRTKDEFAKGHIKGSIMIDFYKGSFKNDLESLDKEKVYYIYCRSGGRSGRALSLMKQLGFKTVYNLKGGIISWESHKYPKVY
jgi:phage shock protein E